VFVRVVDFGPERAVVRPKGPTVPRTARAIRGIVGPLGRNMSLGAFPGPLGRAGRMAGPLGRSMVGSLPVGAGVFGRMPIGADTEVRPPATLLLAPCGRCARRDAQRTGAVPVDGLFSAHRGWCFRMNAHGSGHRGPPPRHPVTGSLRTMCSEGRSAERGSLGRQLSLGPFPARWAGLGERLALWAVHRRLAPRRPVPARRPRRALRG